MSESVKVKTPTPAAGAVAPTDTIIIDLGNHKRKQVRQLRRGKGKLLASIQQRLEQLRQDGTIPAGAPPVIVVVGKKPPQNPFFPA